MSVPIVQINRSNVAGAIGGLEVEVEVAGEQQDDQDDEDNSGRREANGPYPP